MALNHTDQCWCLPKMYFCSITTTVREPCQKSSVGGTDPAENHIQNPGQGHEEHRDLDRLAVFAGRCHTAEKGTQPPSPFYSELGLFYDD